MKLLCLDYYNGYEPADFAEFDSSTSCYDYDAVIWQPENSLHHYTQYGEAYMGLPSLAEYSSVKVNDDIKRRRKEFLEFMNSGRTLIVIAGPPQEFYFDTGQRSYSGTGRNRATTRHVNKNDIWAALPAEISLSAAGGKNIQLLGDGELLALLNKYSKYMQYTAILDTAPGTPIAKVSGTTKILGSMVNTQNGGKLIILPAFSFPDDEDEENKNDDAALFQADLLDYLNSQNGTVEALPNWASSYRVKGEEEAIKIIVKNEKALAALNEKLDTAQSSLRGLENKKHLFTGSGNQLEIEVRKVLELLGAEVKEPEPGRDDWIALFPEGPMVVEVKGVSKSGAEKHSAQLEKWVVNYLENEGTLPKGLLVVNTWRTKLLSERTEIDFPDQMIAYSTARNHALVTGLQLLGIREAIERNPKLIVEVRKKLFSTSGRFLEFADYKDFVTTEDTTSDTKNERA